MRKEEHLQQQHELIRASFFAMNTKDANSEQINVLSQLAMYLNTTEKQKRANDGKDYVVLALQKEEEEPIFKTELPDAPHYDTPNYDATKESEEDVEETIEPSVIAQIELSGHHVEITSDNRLALEKTKGNSILNHGVLHFEEGVEMWEINKYISNNIR